MLGLFIFWAIDTPAFLNAADARSVDISLLEDELLHWLLRCEYVMAIVLLTYHDLK